MVGVGGPSATARQFCCNPAHSPSLGRVGVHDVGLHITQQSGNSMGAQQISLGSNGSTEAVNTDGGEIRGLSFEVIGFIFSAVSRD